MGGTVRDALLNRCSDYLDLDFVLPEGAVETARSIARHYNAGFVLLDAERQIARVVFEQGTADFALQVGSSLEIDLQRRDFTVNAIAYNPHHETLIDPLCGYLDLQRRMLRMVSAANLQEDPLRLLRAYRQAAQLDFGLESETRTTIHQLAPLLNKIAAERVQSELAYLLSTSRGTPWLIAAWEDQLLRGWFPSATADSLAQVAAIDRSAWQLGEIWPTFGEELYLNIRSVPKCKRSQPSWAPASKPVDAPPHQKQVLVCREGSAREPVRNLPRQRGMGTPAIPRVEPKPSGTARTWMTIAKLACLVAPDPQQASIELRQLKYSRAEIQAVASILKFLPTLQEVATPGEISLKSQYLFFQAAGAVFPALAVLGVAAGTAVQSIAPLIDRFLCPNDPVAHPTPLITGQELMAALQVSPGPRVGELLAAIQLARAEGKISTPAQALEFAALLLEHSDPHRE